MLLARANLKNKILVGSLIHPEQKRKYQPAWSPWRGHSLATRSAAMPYTVHVAVGQWRALNTYVWIYIHYMNSCVLTSCVVVLYKFMSLNSSTLIKWQTTVLFPAQNTMDLLHTCTGAWQQCMNWRFSKYNFTQRPLMNRQLEYDILGLIRLIKSKLINQIKIKYYTFKNKCRER